VLLLLGALNAASTSQAVAYGGGVAMSVIGAVLVYVLGVRGPAPLGLLLGASAYAPTRTTRNISAGAPLVAGALRIWWQSIGVIALLVLLLSFGSSGLLLGILAFPAQPGAAVSALAFGGGVVLLSAAIPALVCLAALVLLAVPALLVALARFTVEVASSPSWVPAARRYALTPALPLLAALSGALLIGGWYATAQVDWGQSTVVELQAGSTPLTLTLRGAALFGALALPYLLLLELPFRLGMRRWRHTWLGDLTTRRADVESHVRRLSASDPRSGAQDTSDENLRAMQYDLVLLQFYREKMGEATRTSGGPFALVQVLVALLITAAAALFLDTGIAPLTHLLPR
jgi:hypothetical protein